MQLVRDGFVGSLQRGNSLPVRSLLRTSALQCLGQSCCQVGCLLTGTRLRLLGGGGVSHRLLGAHFGAVFCCKSSVSLHAHRLCLTAHTLALLARGSSLTLHVSCCLEGDNQLGRAFRSLRQRSSLAVLSSIKLFAPARLLCSKLLLRSCCGSDRRAQLLRELVSGAGTKLRSLQSCGGLQQASVERGNLRCSSSTLFGPCCSERLSCGSSALGCFNTGSLRTGSACLELCLERSHAGKSLVTLRVQRRNGGQGCRVFRLKLGPTAGEVSGGPRRCHRRRVGRTRRRVHPRNRLRWQRLCCGRALFGSPQALLQGTLRLKLLLLLAKKHRDFAAGSLKAVLQLLYGVRRFGSCGGRRRRRRNRACPRGGSLCTRVPFRGAALELCERARKCCRLSFCARQPRLEVGAPGQGCRQRLGDGHRVSDRQAFARA